MAKKKYHDHGKPITYDVRYQQNRQECPNCKKRASNVEPTNTRITVNEKAGCRIKRVSRYHKCRCKGCGHRWRTDQVHCLPLVDDGMSFTTTTTT